jgi:uncharacterized OsmC-like protein
MNNLNGIDTAALRDVIGAVSAAPELGQVKFGVTTTWKGQTRMESRATSFTLAGQSHARDFTIVADEPEQLLGQNSAPNPQELLMSAMNSCMMVGYVANAAMMGVKLDKLSIQTEGDLDLRGFLGLDPSIAPGNSEIRYTITVKANATTEQLTQLHDIVVKTSPNRWNIAQPVSLKATLVIEQ